MKIDLLYELQMPKPWSKPQAEGEYEVYWQAMEQIELADKVGFDTVWLVEHHFRTERSHSPGPEIFLGAAAQRTKNIRLGHGVVLLPFEFNHPIRVAERAAVLDILSKGRLEFGTGRSTLFEQEGFGVDPAVTRDQWREAMEVIPKMWTNETFALKTEHFDLPERNILPKPHQKPHPPMWMATTQEESFPLAGELGLGALGLTIMVPLEEAAERVKLYRKGIERAKPLGAFVNNQIAIYTMVHCAETKQQAIDNGFYDAVFWWFDRSIELRAAFTSGSFGKHKYAKYPWITQLLNKEIGPEAFDQADMVIGGSPDDVIRQLERHEEIGLDHVLCQMQVGYISHEKIMRSLELFGEYVIPHFKARARGKATTGVGAGGR